MSVVGLWVKVSPLHLTTVLLYSTPGFLKFGGSERYLGLVGELLHMPKGLVLLREGRLMVMIGFLVHLVKI